MIYQLPSGKTIELTVEQYLDMSDEELEYLSSQSFGDVIDDPWFGSVLTHPSSNSASDDYIEDLTSVTIEEKLANPDIDISSTEE